MIGLAREDAIEELVEWYRECLEGEHAIDVLAEYRTKINSDTAVITDDDGEVYEWAEDRIGMVE